MIKGFLLLSCAMAPFMIAPAQAQTAEAPATDEVVGVQDIIVTAERRSESLQRSSLAIEVFSGEALHDVTKPTDLTLLTPGVQIGTTGPQTQVYIRGVGDTAVNSRSQGAVAFNVDGIYYARGTQVTPSFFDLARIEVLKGPQGTLYGRNASGGAVNIITQAPVLGEWSGYVSGEVGSFNLKQGSAAINVPIGENLALRAAGQIIDRDGYVSDGGQDQKIKAGRLRLLWEPTEAISLLVNGDVLHIGGVGSGVVTKPSPDGNPWRGNTQAPYAYPYLFGPGTAPLTDPNDRFVDSDTVGVSAELNADLGFATLTLIPSYRRQKQEYVSYNSYFRFFEGTETVQQTGEVRLSHESSMLKWVAGLYYFNEKQDAQFSIALGNRTAVDFDTDLTSYAAFAQMTVSLTDNLRVIGGIRHTSEKQTGSYETGTGLMPVIPFQGTGQIVDIGNLKFKKTNFKLGAEYDVSSTSMLFATYATGFKAGGFNQTTSCGADPFGPENLKAWTVGSRNRFADNRLQVNVEGFYWKYVDQQISFTGADNCGGITQLVRNPGNATMKGFNLDAVWRATANDTIRVAFEYNDAKYTSYLLTQFGLGTFAPGGGSRCSTSATPGRPGFFDISCVGQQLSRSPKVTASASYERVFKLANDGDITFAADIQYVGPRWLEFTYIPNGRADAHTLVNAQLTYHAPNDRWSITGYVSNITNAVAYTNGVPIQTTNAPNGFRYVTATILAPRAFGVRGRFNF